MMSTEVSARLGSLDGFAQLLAEHPEYCDPQWIEKTAACIVNGGAVEPLTRTPIPGKWTDNLDNLREGLTFNAVNSRGRAVMLCLEEILAGVPDPKIYATEAVTHFALRLRGMFPKFIGSEYADTLAQRAELFPIPSEDLQDLSFPSDVFDAVITNEVLEHVPSIDVALGEICRVLKPGGWHIGTVPFACGQDAGVIKAKWDGGRIIHLMEPEYHENPLSGEGSLVFEIPGWNILERARGVGFTDAHMRYILSSRSACMSSDVGGVLILALQK